MACLAATRPQGGATLANEVRPISCALLGSGHAGRTALLLAERMRSGDAPLGVTPAHPIKTDAAPPTKGAWLGCMVRQEGAGHILQRSSFFAKTARGHYT